MALVNGNVTVKTFYQKHDHIELRPENAMLQPIVVTPDDELNVQGLVEVLFAIAGKGKVRMMSKLVTTM